MREVASRLIFGAASEKPSELPNPPVHDAVAVASAIERGILRTRPMRVDVRCEGEDHGRTVCTVPKATGRGSNADVGVGLDREAFFGLLHESVKAGRYEA